LNVPDSKFEDPENLIGSPFPHLSTQGVFPISGLFLRRIEAVPSPVNEDVSLILSQKLSSKPGVRGFEVTLTREP
jgi:hypothetical protein